MKKLASMVVLCALVIIANAQTPALSTLTRFVNAPIPDLTEEMISIDGWELAKSEVVDSVITLQFEYRDATLTVRKVRNYKNEILLICDKQNYDNLNKSLIALKPKLIGSEVKDNGHIVKSYSGEKYGYKVSIAPKSLFVFEVFDKEDYVITSSLPIKSIPAKDATFEYSGFGETPIALRKLTNLVMPQDDGKKTGKIAVRIKIDKTGNVIDATAGVKGTTLNDRDLWQKCKDAVIGTKLTQSDSAPDVQIGVVVFNFRVK